MGQANRYQRQLEARFPGCVYCGGQNKATTIDHAPPIAAFEGRDRPRGGEVRACLSCHKPLALVDRLASMITFVAPVTESQRGFESFKRLMIGIEGRLPGVLGALRAPAEEVEKLRREGLLLDGAGAIATGHPAIEECVDVFLTRIAFAIYADRTGTPLPTAGAAQPFWWTNVHAARQQIPLVYGDLVGAVSSLQQGIKDTKDQFRYAIKFVDENTMAVVTGHFRRSILFAVFLAVDSAMLDTGVEKSKPIYPTGFLRGFDLRARLAAPAA